MICLERNCIGDGEEVNKSREMGAVESWSLSFALGLSLLAGVAGKVKSYVWARVAGRALPYMLHPSLRIRFQIPSVTNSLHYSATHYTLRLLVYTTYNIRCYSLLLYRD